jgi:peptidoglycan/LPS O-acetylase OafA/YrhL
MGLKKFDNMLMFSFARYLRLAPAMIIASIFLYFSYFLIPENPRGIANLQDFLPSITFINPGFLTKILGIDIRGLDPAFWSLYVEVKFYFFSAILFFILKDKNLNGLVILYIFKLLLVALIKFKIEPNYVLTANKILEQLGINYYGWFLLGVYSYKYTQTLSARHTLMFTMLITVSSESIINGGNIAILIASTITALLFVVPLFNQKFKSILSSNILLFFGFISYPLYLIHQNLVTGLSIKLYNSGLKLPSFYYPLPFIALIILIAFLIAKLEPLIKNFLKKNVPIKLFGIKINKK